ncbi:MAG: hypothetical protein DLM57_16375 [Pseudonocardiales bacterium]|nr:MAG: hypothetical protein DLM57_16375 [Pseudonocardiales bacterium]
MILVVVALSLSFAATYARDSKHLVAGISTASDVPGTCHLAHDYFESEMAVAELTPPVPCTAPHSSETLWTRQLTGILALQHNRPTPELLSGQYKDVCQDPTQLDHYIGHIWPGFPYNLVVYPRYPSAPEWRAGLRTVRCVGSLWFNQGVNRLTWSFPLRGSWSRTMSAIIRLCADAAGAYLPCDRPHVDEVLEPLNPFPATQISFPAPQLSRRLGLGPCTREALDLLGRKSIPREYQVVVEPAERQNWPHSHDVGCRIRSSVRSGTLAAGLT